MEDKKTSSGLIILPSNELTPGVSAALQQFETAKNLPATQEPEEIHKIEFIMFKAYWICNACVNGVWRTNSYPATTTVGEFLLSGGMHAVKQWPRGRAENNGG